MVVNYVTKKNNLQCIIFLFLIDLQLNMTNLVNVCSLYYAVEYDNYTGMNLLQHVKKYQSTESIVMNIFFP